MDSFCLSTHSDSVCPAGRREGSAHLVMLLVQKPWPGASGSRLRKSRYCWLTKNSGQSIALGHAAAGSDRYVLYSNRIGAGAASIVTGRVNEQVKRNIQWKVIHLGAGILLGPPFGGKAPASLMTIFKVAPPRRALRCLPSKT